MKRLSVFCHSVCQLMYLLLALEPVVGIYEGYLYCEYLLCPIGAGILVCLTSGVDELQKPAINQRDPCRIIYVLIIATGIIISYIYHSNLLKVWLFMTAMEIADWIIQRRR